MQFMYKKKKFKVERARVITRRDSCMGSLYEKAWIDLMIDTPGFDGDTESICASIGMQANLNDLKAGDQKKFYGASLKTEEDYALDSYLDQIKPTHYNEVRYKALKRLKKRYRAIVDAQQKNYGDRCQLQELIQALESMGVKVDKTDHWTLTF